MVQNSCIENERARIELEIVVFLRYSLVSHFFDNFVLRDVAAKNNPY